MNKDINYGFFIGIVTLFILTTLLAMGNRSVSLFLAILAGSFIAGKLLSYATRNW